MILTKERVGDKPEDKNCKDAESKGQTPSHRRYRRQDLLKKRTILAKQREEKGGEEAREKKKKNWSPHNY